MRPAEGGAGLLGACYMATQAHVAYTYFGQMVKPSIPHSRVYRWKFGSLEFRARVSTPDNEGWATGF